MGDYRKAWEEAHHLLPKLQAVRNSLRRCAAHETISVESFGDQRRIAENCLLPTGQQLAALTGDDRVDLTVSIEGITEVINKLKRLFTGPKADKLLSQDKQTDGDVLKIIADDLNTKFLNQAWWDGVTLKEASVKLNGLSVWLARDGRIVRDVPGEVAKEVQILTSVLPELKNSIGGFTRASEAIFDAVKRETTAEGMVNTFTRLKTTRPTPPPETFKHAKRAFLGSAKGELVVREVKKFGTEFNHNFGKHGLDHPVPLPVLTKEQLFKLAGLVERLLGLYADYDVLYGEVGYSRHLEFLGDAFEEVEYKHERVWREMLDYLGDQAPMYQLTLDGVYVMQEICLNVARALHRYITLSINEGNQ
jgi:hypothetical protein